MSLFLASARRAWKTAARPVWSTCLSLLLLALVLGWTATTEAGAVLLLEALERQAPAPSPAQLRSAQAIVLLGGRRARVDAAARLHQETGLPLLVTGRGTGDGPYPAESEKMAEILWTQFRIPVRWLETESFDTEENAAFSWCLVRGEGIRRIALVTDPRHMFRARLAFERVGFEVIPAPTDHTELPKQPLGLASFVPSREGYKRAKVPLKEWAGIAMLLVPGSSPCLRERAGVRAIPAPAPHPSPLRRGEREQGS